MVGTLGSDILELAAVEKQDDELEEDDQEEVRIEMWRHASHAWFVSNLRITICNGIEWA